MFVYWLRAGAETFFPDDEHNPTNWTVEAMQAKEQCGAAAPADLMALPAKYKKYADSN